MTTSYSCFKIIEFPFDTENKIAVPVQETIDGIEEQPETNFSAENVYPNSDFRQFEAYHELVVERYGRVYGKDFYKYLEPKKFNIYASKNKNLLLAKVSQNVANDFVARCNKITGFDCARHKVDYEKISHILPTITGAWFAEMKTSFLKSAGYFGRNVDKSSEFKEAAGKGQISSLIIELNKNGYSHTIGITRNASVVLYKNYSDTKYELEIVLEIFDKFIDI